VGETTLSVRAALAALVLKRASPAGAAWFKAAFDDACVPIAEDFLAAIAGAGRRLGRVPVEPDEAETGGLHAAGLAPVPAGWGLDECGRGALILKAGAYLPSTARIALLVELFYKGDIRERQALLRVLAYLPSPADFRDVAIEACRASAQTVFEAIACENAYPAAHFTEASFNQMVLKAVFTGAAVHRIVGLRERITPELVRMAADYARERRAAGRPVPADVDAIVSPGARPA
jgi:hypothetical protein